MTPGARPAAALSMEAMRAFATVLRTITPWAWPRWSNSAA
jgi:hypothetical protein